MVGRRSGALILDTYLMTSAWQGSFKGFRKVNLLQYDVAAGAVCDKAHWTLIIMYLKEMRAVYLDPFGATEEQVKKCQAVTRALVRTKHPTITKWTCSTVPHPKQQDSKSCGVFVCKLAEQMLLVQDINYPVDQEGVARLRLDLAVTLLKNSDDLSDMCKACGEASSGAEVDEWIECTTCGRWYHMSCVGHPSTDGASWAVTPRRAGRGRSAALWAPA
ncbi:sentrin-specific protease 2-like [Stegastes partitus]|uniref:Sentrin-specific protease 2-like n=1 Tax=Stegastes partitus TaxID=144197 RepID=A0A9Y4KIW1_9TELE|nr:PREDICTED: sentrin-specific protease 2-like [Stegastes partitus]